MTQKSLSIMMVDELTDFLARSPTADEIYFFEFSASITQTYQHLRQKMREHELSQFEQGEVLEYLKMDRLLSTLQDKALLYLDDAILPKVFSKSWDQIVQYYEEFNQDYEFIKYPMLALIDELRQAGWDQVFRAGQAMFALMLSRSKRHGLRLEQPFLRIHIELNGEMFLQYFEPPDRLELRCDKVAITPELNDLLERLKAHPLD